MEPRNVCRNSVFLTPGQRQATNDSVNEYLATVSSEIAARDVHANVYYTGSIARGEPSVMHRDGRTTLSSDVDFVVVLGDNQEKDAWLRGIAGYFNSRYPSVRSSFTFIPAGALSRMKSLIGRDLSLAISEPVHQSFATPPFVPGRITRYNFLEAIIYQMGCYYLHQEMVKSDRKDNVTVQSLRYHYTKLILECLVGRFYPDVQITTGYFNVARNRSHPRLKPLLDEETVAQFVRSRELADYENAPIIDVDSLVCTCVREHLRELSGGVSDAFSAVANWPSEAGNIIGLYQSAIMAYVLGVAESPRSPARWNDLILRAFALSGLGSRSHTTSYRLAPEGTGAQLTDILATMRYEYIQALHTWNTGEAEWSDLLRLSSLHSGRSDG